MRLPWFCVKAPTQSAAPESETMMLLRRLSVLVLSNIRIPVLLLSIVTCVSVVFAPTAWIAPPLRLLALSIKLLLVMSILPDVDVSIAPPLLAKFLTKLLFVMVIVAPFIAIAPPDHCA